MPPTKTWTVTSKIFFWCLFLWLGKLFPHLCLCISLLVSVVSFLMWCHDWSTRSLRVCWSRLSYLYWTDEKTEVLSGHIATRWGTGGQKWWHLTPHPHSSPLTPWWAFPLAAGQYPPRAFTVKHNFHSPELTGNWGTQWTLSRCYCGFEARDCLPMGRIGGYMRIIPTMRSTWRKEKWTAWNTWDTEYEKRRKGREESTLRLCRG